MAAPVPPIGVAACPTATLRDGTVATVRRLGPDDFDDVLALADSLTGEEKYLRFFTEHPMHMPQWASSVTEPERAGVSLGAFDHGELVGVANYTPLPESGVAEVAIVVAHDEHDRGIGTALLAELAATARSNGQHHLIAEVLAENHGMRRLINDAHVPVTWHLDGAVFDADVDLDALQEPR
jgi:RimJ/RimL family protein N-acetyltransferase